MNGIKTEERRYPCCVYETEDLSGQVRDFHFREVKSYGEDVSMEDGTMLHENYEKGERKDGRRALVRCCRCGALFISMYSVEYDFYDGPDSMTSWYPVASEEEADLLNILLDGKETFLPPTRHFYRYNWDFRWSAGPEPHPCDPEELKKRIREKYADADPELLEKLIRQAGQEHAAEKAILPETEPEEDREEEDEQEYSYLADFDCDPPALIRLGSLASMKADRFDFPGVWKDTPRLNDIRFGMGSWMDYFDVTKEEAMEIMQRNREKYDRMAAEKTAGEKGK